MTKRVWAGLGAFVFFWLTIAAAGVFEGRFGDFFDQRALPVLERFWLEASNWFSLSWLSRVATYMTFAGIVFLAVMSATLLSARRLSLRVASLEKRSQEVAIEHETRTKVLQEQHEAARAELQRKYEELKDFHEYKRRRDHLTNLPNWRALDEFFDRELEKMVAERRPVTFVLLDIDGFGAMNDEFGPEKCNRVLRSFGPFIANELRSNEPAFRISRFGFPPDVFRLNTGGDEFVCFLRGTEVDALFLLARLFQEIAHEGKQWGMHLGVEEYVPRFNVAVYQYLHSTDWISRLASNPDLEENVTHAFPRARERSTELVEVLKSRNFLDQLAAIEQLTDDDTISAREALFTLGAASKKMSFGWPEEALVSVMNIKHM